MDSAICTDAKPDVNALFTSDLPKVEGFYLHRQHGGRLFLLLVEERDGQMIVERDDAHVHYWRGEWLGPIDGACAL